MIKLSILIPTLPQRKELYDNLVINLYKQIGQCNALLEVEVLSNNAIGFTIGEKRNHLLNLSQGEYVAYIDDDDEISADYIKDILKAIEGSPDCVSLRGVITWDGANPELFEHSLRYPAYVTHTIPVDGIKYYRYPNHLNTIKASIAKQFKFPEINHGEDSDWAKQIHDSGLIKTETYIDKILYHYLFKPSK